MLTITVDTNILVSALIAKGKPRRLIKEIEQKNVNLVLSDSIILELEIVLEREKFRKYVTLNAARNYVDEVKSLSKIVKIKSKFKVIKEDPDDDLVINTAYDGKADYVVSGDKHLLNLKNFKGVKIVTVSEMLKILKRK